MVVKRKLNCGSNGFGFFDIPKGPRSNRRKVLSKRSDDDDNQICAFDLLASLAGKLLEESESSSTSTYAFEGDAHDHLGAENKHCKSESSDQGNLTSKSSTEHTSETCLKFSSSLENDCISDQKPVFDCKKACGLKSLVGGITEETGVVNEGVGFEQGEAIGVLEKGSLKDPCQLHLQSPESVHLDEDLKLPPFVDRVTNCSFEGYRNHSNLASRDDDDENYRKFYKFSEKRKSNRPQTRVGNRRIKKALTTKYRRANPKLKCFEDTRTDGCLKALYRKRKVYHGYNQRKHETFCRKRRLCDKGLVVNYDRVLSSESASNSPEKGETGTLTTYLLDRDIICGSHVIFHFLAVKFSIKSFRIPELLIEVPETETVGSLKRTVKEAVTALIAGGIRIGVLVKGKKVRDDNNILSQTGLSCRENLSNLGFTLEPGPEPLRSETPVVSVPTDSKNLSEKSTASPVVANNLCVENKYDLVPYQDDISADEQPSSDSRELVPVSAFEPESRAIVPINEKPKRTELSQRRTRRPFSVTEVEALVESVEELGTGRWRDVKFRSFEFASHRTYVDLKDKWKTLVHTASISPQQRRGEPVPQELLDRVLAAHGYWSQHQMRQNGKHQVAATKAIQSSSAM